MSAEPVREQIGSSRSPSIPTPSRVRPSVNCVICSTVTGQTNVNRQRHTARTHRLTVAGAVPALVVAATLVWLLAAPRPNRLSRVLRQRGYPATLAELDAWYPAVPAAQNAALVYTNAFAQLTNSAGTVTNFFAWQWLPAIGRGFTADERAELAGVFEANRETLRLLHSVPASARSRYPINLREGYTLALPYLAQTKQAVLLLASEALVQAGEGNAEAATRSLLAAGQVAESVAEEPLLVSQKVRAMNWNALVARLERALSLTAFSESQLSALQHQVRAAERPEAPLRGWVTEWVAGKTLFEDRRIMQSALIAQFLIAPNSSGAQFARLNSLTKGGCLSLLGIAGQQEKDKAFFLAYVERRVAAMELPYPARFEAMQRLGAITNAPGRWCFFSQMLFSARPLLDCQDAEHTARVRLAATVLAIERFRIAHGRTLPSSLAELVPTWLEKLPLDPFDGRPLRYQKNGASYVVYSVAGDCQDNGGVAWDKECFKSPSDIAVIVKH